MCIYALPLTTSCCLIPSNCMQLFYIVRLIMFPIWLATVIIFCVWLLIVKTDKHLVLLWLCNYYLLNTIVSWLVNGKIMELCITKLGSNRKMCNPFLKSGCISELSWIFLKNTNAQVLPFFSRAPDVFNEQSYLEKLDYRIFYFYIISFTFFYFIFSTPISLSLCSPTSPFFFMFFLKTLSSTVEKLLYTYV